MAGLAENCPIYSTKIVNSDGTNSMVWWRFFAAISVGLFSDLVLAPDLVSKLPANPQAGSMATVNDALAPAIGSAVASGGAAFAAVMWNGTQWTVFSI